ncbi:MAG: glycosyltransferase family 9 protein [Candidatus Latescibacteria bacterium]|nr:glycosyltransferase family 9 protein [Candidatus Latescibacterota bacterium]
MKILIVRFSSLGDIVLTSPATRALRLKYPEAHISFAVKAMYASIACLLPGVDSVISLKPDQPFLSFLHEIREESFDIIIDLHANPRSIILGRLGRGSKTVTYNNRRLARMRMVSRFGGSIETRHTIENYLSALNPLGIERANHQTELQVGANEEQSVADRLMHSGIGAEQTLLGIAPGASSTVKQWPAKFFAEIADRLNAPPSMGILVVGGHQDRATATDIVSLSRADLLNWVGDLDIGLLPAALSRCRAVLSNDSGPMHVASAVGTPVLGLFGPTHPRLGFAPIGTEDLSLTLDLDCSPCSRHGNRPCWKNTRACLEEMSPDQVFSKLSRLLDTQKCSTQPDMP